MFSQSLGTYNKLEPGPGCKKIFHSSPISKILAVALWLGLTILTLADKPLRPAGQTKLEAGTTQRALIIGIDNYAPGYASPLPSCVNDAIGIRDIALLGDPEGRWLESNIVLLTDDQATKETVRGVLAQLAAHSQAGDHLVYYHSSHGGQISGTDTFLCTYDTNYYDWELGADLALFNSEVRIVIIIDACHAAGMYKQAGWPFIEQTLQSYRVTKANRLASQGLPIPKDLGENIGFMVSADYDQVCWAGNPYSLYTNFLLEACNNPIADLNQDNELQFLEMQNYAKPRAQAINPGQIAQTYNHEMLETMVVRAMEDTVSIPLPEAIGQPDWTIHIGGNAAWFGIEYEEETYAAQSGLISHNQETWMETTVEGPGQLEFQWKVSSEANYDFLEFHVNGQRLSRISGELDWQQMNYELGNGPQTLRWRYVKDFSINRGADAGWIRQVAWTTVPDRVIRTITDNQVGIAVNPPAGTQVWGVEEELPPGITPVIISGSNGNWDADQRTLTWWGTGDQEAIMNYAVAGNPGSYQVSGIANFGDQNIQVAGDDLITLEHRYHPADTNQNWRITMSEAIAYLASWQQGENPMNLAIRAAYLWQNGEHYTYDFTQPEPMSWIPAID